MGRLDLEVLNRANCEHSSTRLDKTMPQGKVTSACFSKLGTFQVVGFLLDSS